jgi:hypothetical protein
VTLLMAGFGTPRRFAAVRAFGRDRSEADMQRTSGAGRSDENDPERTSSLIKVLKMDIFEWLLDALLGRWTLRGEDVFSSEYYHLPGRHWTEALARMAARRRLRYLERTQPSASSGGQKEPGIQDRVFIVRPDKTCYRYVPANWPY